MTIKQVVPQVTKAEAALLDFQYFIGHYLGMSLWNCQKVWADKVQTVIDSDEYDGLQLLAPADHGKTSRIVVALPLWLWARDRSNRIILIGNTDPYAEQIGRSIMNRIERTPSLDTDFGIRPGLKWAASELHIERKNWEDKDPSLQCLGVGSEIQSQRADYIIGDDMATRRNSRTETQRKALATYVHTDLASRLDKTVRRLGKGKFLYFGHRVDNNDVYQDNDGRKKWMYHIDRAIIDDTEKKILCPEGHDYEALAEMRSKDNVGFELMYQQRSAAMGTFCTLTAMEACRVPSLKFIQSMTSENRSQFKYTWMSLDPAFTTTRWSSHAVFNLWGMLPDGRRRLLWAFREKTSPEQLTHIMEMKFRLFMPDHFLIEANQGQILLLPHLRRKFPDHASKFKPVYTENHNGSLEEELGRLFDLYSCDKPLVEIPYGGVTEQAYAHQMTEEYTGYPSHPRRDTLMSQYIGEKGLGLIKHEMRSGYTHSKGVMGSVAAKYRQRISAWRR